MHQELTELELDSSEGLGQWQPQVGHLHNTVTDGSGVHSRPDSLLTDG